MAKHKELEQRYERLEQQLRVFQTVSRLMTKETSLLQVLKTIVEMVQQFTLADSAIIYLAEEGELVLSAATNVPDHAVGKVRLRMEEGLTGWVARERRLLALSKEAYADPRFKSFRELEADTFEAFLSTPVIARNRMVGVVNVQHREPHFYTGEEMEMMTTLAEQVGCLLLLARLDKEALDKQVPVVNLLAGVPAVSSR